MSQTVGNIKAKAQALFLTGETMAAIAKRLGVSTRTIQRWADAGGWREQRTVLPMERRGNQRSGEHAGHEPDGSSQRPGRRKINELEIVDLALGDLSGVMGTGDLDPRVMGGLATGICRLIELRLKLSPKTAAEFADQVLASNITPSEFVAELKRQWQQRA